MIVRYVYGTMIGESMTRDTKSAGAGAMRVVVRVSNFISISSNIRNFINLSININMTSSSRISSITKASTKGSVLGWCLDALLPSHHLCLHRKPQGTKSPHLIRIQERHNMIIDQAFLTNPGLTSPIDTLEDVLGSGLPWGMVGFI